MKFLILFYNFLIYHLLGIVAIGQNGFEEFTFKHSIEELLEIHSSKLMNLAQEEIDQLIETNNKGLYKGTIESIQKHPTPDWYKDAKLGIFYDWGLYSVAGYGVKEWSRARYPDWYLIKMYNEYKEYHRETWGDDFHRDDFIPLFTAENFNAVEIVDLVKNSGAKYFIPFSKHHDGYCMWDSKYTLRDVVDMMPGRDIAKELVSECVKQDIYHGFYFSVEEYEYPIIEKNSKIAVRYWARDMAPDNAGTIEKYSEIIGEFNSAVHNRMLSGKIPIYHFIDDYIVPQAKEYIDKYNPDILWFDGEWHRPANFYKTPDIVAYFYNKNSDKKEVVSNDRLGMETRGHAGDFYTSETDEVVEKMNIPWEENRSMSESYGFNKMDSLSNYLTAEELIHMLVRIVAKGGNLNLIVNPDGTGEIPDIQIELLSELGEWLTINGEAIYNTRPFETLCDNTQLGQPVWYTMSKDSLYGYAIILDWPKSETFICKGANMIWEEEVHMLGVDEPLEWVDVGRRLWGMSAKIPNAMLSEPEKRPCKYAWVLKFKYDRYNKYGN